MRNLQWNMTKQTELAGDSQYALVAVRNTKNSTLPLKMISTNFRTARASPLSTAITCFVFCDESMTLRLVSLFSAAT